METLDALASFTALSQETRLQAFKLLVRHEPEGLAAGEIARQLGVPHNTMSAHLAILARAQLVASKRQSRSIIYRANLERMQATIQFLVHDCCDGHLQVFYLGSLHQPFQKLYRALNTHRYLFR